MKTNKSLLLYLVFCFFLKLGLSQNTECLAVNSTKYGVSWPSIANGEKTFSSPPCVGKSKEFLYRECVDGTWATEPDCDFVQPIVPRHCPNGFIDTGNICYQFSLKSAFPPQCPYEDPLPFDSYIHEIYVSEPIWMPVKRDLSNGLGFLQWIEASSRYRTDFDDFYYVTGSVKDKDCLLYYNSSYIAAVSCNEEHVGVCAYQIFEKQDNQFCVDSEKYCVVKDFSSKAKCVCVPFSNGTSIAEFIEPYECYIPWGFQNYQGCNIGLQRNSDGKYMWTVSQKEISYTCWAPDVNFSKENIYGVVGDGGWGLQPAPSKNCYVQETQVKIPQPTLVLHLRNLATPTPSSLSTSSTSSTPSTTISSSTPTSGSLHSFELIVNNENSLKKIDEENYLISCFTNAYPFEILHRPSLTKILNVYSFSILLAGPGQLWCESLYYPGLKPIVINVELFSPYDRHLDYEFMAILRVNYVKDINPLSKDMVSFLESKLINLNLEDYMLRIMKIEDVDEKNVQISVNVHFSLTTFSADHADEEYISVKRSIENKLLQTEDVTMVEFRNFHYCAEERTSEFLWPKTLAGWSITQLCFTSDGKELTRVCKRNSFVDGANWEKVEPCNRPAISDMAQEVLTALAETQPEKKCETGKQMLEQYSKFDAFDIYVAWRVLSECFETEDETDLFLEVYSNITNIKHNILDESETKMKSTTRLLNLFSERTTIGTTGTTTVKQNIIQARLTFINAKGILLLKSGDGFETKELTGGTTEDIFATENLDSGFWFNFESESSIVETDRAALTFFFDNSLFIEQALVPKKLTTVFGAVTVQLQPQTAASLLEIWFVQRVSSVDNTKTNCLSWDHVNGYWKIDGELETRSSHVICKFLPSDGYYALTPVTNKLTGDLSDLLQCNCTVLDTIQTLLNYSKRYSEFASIDVYLAGKILEKVSTDPNVDLDALAEIVNNLVTIDRDVLAESQQENSSTDLILHYLDEILKNHEYRSPVSIIKQNFVLVIVKLKDSNFSGLVSFNKKPVEIVENDYNLVKFLADSSFQTALQLTQQLKDQIGQNSAIITTVFINDALFNPQQSVGKIFGSILPNIGNYSCPISIFHKTTSSKPRRCVYWAYNQTENIPGFWSTDGNVQDTFDLVECQYWHTTHFALLIDKFLENEVLDLITIVNCSLSLFGLTVIIVTALAFEKWRSKTGNQMLLNFVAVIVLQIVIFFVSSGVVKASVQVCTAVGAILHYSIVSHFCWMLVIAILQYKRFVNVLGKPTEKVLWKGCMCGWVLPIVPVVFVLIFGSYVDGNVRLCYPSGMGLYLGVWFPVVLILGVNIFIFANIIFSVVYNNGVRRHSNGTESIFQWRLGILLFFMLGLTWMFGFLAELDVEFFVYLFCTTATLQGFIVFLFFVVLNVKTRNMYWNIFKRCGLHPHHITIHHRNSSTSA